MNTFSPAAALSVDEFCQAHRISRGTFYGLLRSGCGPQIMRVGKRTLVAVEAAERWRRDCERRAAEASSAKEAHDLT